MKTNIKTQKENTVVDWTKNPQLVISHTGAVVLTSFAQTIDNESFSGICVFQGEFNHIGDYANNWKKALFSPFEGSIELSND